MADLERLTPELFRSFLRIVRQSPPIHCCKLTPMPGRSGASAVVLAALISREEAR